MGMCPLGRAKEIEWSVESRTDPRWNKSGTSTVGMIFQQPPKLDRWLAKCKKKYGAYPKDLYYNCEKL